MKRLALILAIALTGCSMTPAQKRTAGIVASVVIVGAIAAHKMDKGDAPPTATFDNDVATPRVTCGAGCMQ